MQVNLSHPKKGGAIRKRNVFLPKAIGAALVCFSIAPLFMIVRTASAQDPITPYVLETEVYGFERDPNGSMGIKTTFARRSDGASVRVENMGPLHLGITGRQITFRDGRSVTVVDAFRMKTTWRPIPAGALETWNDRRLRGMPDCALAVAGEVRVGDDTVAGQNVWVVESELPTGENQLKRKQTQWRAPALGCLRLTYKVEEEQSDGSWLLLTEGRAVSLKLEEPNPKLFNDGADYTEAKPSEVLKKLLELEGIPLDDDRRREGEQMDKAYPKE